MSSFKPIDPKRDEIRRYLERGNVMEPLTKLFIRVIKERPENPMEYIQNNIGIVRHQHDKYERLQKDLQCANNEIQRLREIINRINPEALETKADKSVGDVQPQQNVNQVEAENATAKIKETPPESTEDVKHDQNEETKIGEHLRDAVENCHIADKQTPSAQQSENTTQTVD